MHGIVGERRLWLNAHCSIVQPTLSGLASRCGLHANRRCRRQLQLMILELEHCVLDFPTRYLHVYVDIAQRALLITASLLCVHAMF